METDAQNYCRVKTGMYVGNLCVLILKGKVSNKKQNRANTKQTKETVPIIIFKTSEA